MFPQEMPVSRRTPAPSPATPPSGVNRHGARVLDEPRHDPYALRRKYTEPTHCASCAAIYQQGRWRWGAPTAGSHAAMCPACARIRDALPAGVLTLEGDYVAAHRAELVRIARHQAELEGAEHALHRIMSVTEHGARVEIATTDLHLPHRIGEAIVRAHDGKLTVHYGEDEFSVRARWER